MRMKQVRIPGWAGAIQVQLTNSFFYVSVSSIVIQSLTLWTVAKEDILAVVPWANYWLLLGIGVIILIAIMLADYKFMYPTRMAFLNEQSCKHSNPAMEEILSISRRLASMQAQVNRIEKAVGGENIE